MQPTIKFYNVPHRPIYSGFAIPEVEEYRRLVPVPPQAGLDIFNHAAAVNRFGTPVYSNKCQKSGRGF